MIGTWCLWAALAGLSPSSPSPDEVIAVAAIPVIIDESARPISATAIAGEVANAASGRHLLRVLTAEEMFVDDSADLFDDVRRCGADERCLSLRLSAVRAQLGVVVLVNLVAEPAIVAVRLVDTRERKVVASAIGPLGGGERSVLEAVRSRVAQLLDTRGYVLVGRLVVHAVPDDARVEVRGPAASLSSSGKNVFELVPGRYAVHVGRDGYLDREVDVDVGAGASANVEVALTEETSIFESPWLWIGVGLAVVAGASIAVITASSSGGECICIGPPEMCERC